MLFSIGFSSPKIVKVKVVSHVSLFRRAKVKFIIDGKGLALAGTLELPANGRGEAIFLNLTVRVQYSVTPMRF